MGDKARQEPWQGDPSFVLFKPPGLPFGPYTLIGRLGAGGLAEVFLACAPGPGRADRLVVVKRLHERHLKRERLRKSFLDEARLAARMSHPNVVQTFDLGEEDGTHYIVMEYLEGQPLDRLCREQVGPERSLTPALAAHIMAEALDGLHYSHTLTGYDGKPLGVVHCDISPHNVIVTYDGVTKLLDFGAADAASNRARHRDGAVRGKLAYMSPEQTRGGAVDLRTDIWSMGVVLWEALTGARLFRQETDEATVAAVLEREVPDSRSSAPDVPAPLAEVAARALERDPSRRFGSAAEMRQALLDWLADEAPSVGRAQVQELLVQTYEASRLHRRVAVEASFLARDTEQQSFVVRSGATGSEAARVAGAVPPAREPRAERQQKPWSKGRGVREGRKRDSREQGRKGFYAVLALVAVAIVAAIVALLAIDAGGGEEGTSGADGAAAARRSP